MYHVETFNNPLIDQTDLSTRPSLPNLVSLTHQIRRLQYLRCLISYLSGEFLTRQTTYDGWVWLKLTHRSKRQISMRPSLPNLGEFLTRQTTYNEWVWLKLTHRCKRQISTRPLLPNLVSFLLTRLLTMDESHSSSLIVPNDRSHSLPNLVSFSLARLLTMAESDSSPLIVPNDRSPRDFRYRIWWVSLSPTMDEPDSSSLIVANDRSPNDTFVT